MTARIHQTYFEYPVLFLLACAIWLSWQSASTANEALNRSNLPGLVEIVDVPADDVLNIRSEPSGSSDDLGDLRNGDVIEATGLDDSGQWIRIIHFEGDGWISARYTMKLDLSENPLTKLPYPLSCGGTEPFWSFDIGASGSTRWSGIDIQEESNPIAWAIRSRSLGSQANVLKSGPFTAIIHRNKCSDGMSDRTYGWGIDLVRNANGSPQHFAGCCRWQK